MMHNALEIADTIIHLARLRKIDITNLKVQKLLYYAQAWHLVFFDEPLFVEEIEAWVHGPVIPGTFRKFRGYRWNKIDCEVCPIDDPRIIAHLNSVLDTYGGIDATKLEHLTHREPPWRTARGDTPPDEASNAEITTESMKQYYGSLVVTQQG